MKEIEAVSEAYIADRATVMEWAENGDRVAMRYLGYASGCGAPLFGVDDGEIQAWFSTPEKAAAWLAEMEADAAQQADTPDRAAGG